MINTTGLGWDYSSVNIIVLRFLVQLSLPFSMDHTTMHGNSLFEYSFDQTRNIGFSERVDTSLRKGQVDRLCEVEWYSGWISKV